MLTPSPSRNAAPSFGEFPADFAVQPALNIEEHIVETGLGSLRVGVELTHDGADLRQGRGTGFRTWSSFADPTRAGAAQVCQALVVRGADEDLVAHLAHRRLVAQQFDDVAVEFLRDSVATIRIDADLQRLGLQFAQAGIDALAHELHEGGLVLARGLGASAIRALHPGQLLLQRRLHVVQLAQLLVEGFDLLDQLALLGLQGLDALVVLLLELVELGAEFFGNLFYILDISGHGVLLTCD